MFIFKAPTQHLQLFLYLLQNYMDYICWHQKMSTKSQKETIVIVLGFNDTSALVGHFVSSPWEREKRDRRDEREGQGRKRNRNKSKETEEIKTFPLYPYLRKLHDTFAPPDPFPSPSHAPPPPPPQERDKVLKLFIMELHSKHST